MENIEAVMKRYREKRHWWGNRCEGELPWERDAITLADHACEVLPDLLAECEEGIRLYEKYALVAQPVEGEGLNAGKWANATRDAIAKARQP